MLFEKLGHNLGAVNGMVVHDQHLALRQEVKDMDLQITHKQLGIQASRVSPNRLDPLFGEHRRRVDRLAWRGGVCVI